MPSYPRDEMEEMVRRWTAAHALAEADGRFAEHLEAYYAPDCTCSWNVGPTEEFRAEGVEQIRDWALGAQLVGFDGWRYPYDTVLIDERQGQVVAFWRQVAPVNRSDGTPYEVAGVGGSHFTYGGDFKWSRQQDFFDLGNVLALLKELAADGHLPPTLKQKIKRVAWGQPLTGHVKLREDTGGAMRKLRGNLAMARIALFGR